MKISKKNQPLKLNKCTVAQLNYLHMSQISGGFQDEPEDSLFNETCIDCPSADCTIPTTRETGIPPTQSVG